MEGLTVSWVGAVIGIVLATILIIRKMKPLYALTLGPVMGSLIRGANLATKVSIVALALALATMVITGVGIFI